MVLLPFLSILLVVFIIIAILGVVVCVHEWGHFIAARKSGVIVEEFGFGMPPRLFGVQKLNGRWRLIKGRAESQDVTSTIYSVNAIPAGGFVKLYGDGAGGEGGDVAPALASQSFDAATPWRRLIIMVAGVCMNVLLAVGIYYVLLAKSAFVSEPLPLIGNPSFPFGAKSYSIAISNVVPESPAEKAGLKSEDVIVMVREAGKQESVAITSPGDLIAFVSKHNAKKIEVQVQDFTSGRARFVEVTPSYNLKEKRPMIGAALVELVTLSYTSPIEKAASGFLHAVNITGYNIQAMGTIFSAAISQKSPAIVSEAVSGPVGIGRVVDKILKGSEGRLRIVENLLNLVALISISLAFINILPIPAVDGGRVALLLPELILGKKVNKRVENVINTIGFISLIVLSIVITIKDIVHLW